MKVRINGRPEEVRGALNIAELLAEKKLSCDRVVVEHNMRIVPKDEMGSVLLSSDDSLEIVTFVGGG
jgi:thiamine biosynthesis protein ThiS